MKLIKPIIAIVVIILVFFLAFHKFELVDIEGEWIAKKIVLDGKQIYPEEIDKFLTVDHAVSINYLTDSIYISKGVAAHFKIESGKNGDYLITLSSDEKSLNGLFTTTIDTTHIGPEAYKVDLKIKSKSTFLYFQKVKVIPPWKPPFPKKGQV